MQPEIPTLRETLYVPAKPKPKTPSDFTDTPLFFIIIGFLMCCLLGAVFFVGAMYERRQWNQDCSAMGQRHTDRVYICMVKG